MKHRSHTGYTRGKIVELLLEKENQRLRFMDILKKIGVSKNVLSSHLKILKNEGTIFSKKEGRENYYMLSKNMYKILERRINVLTSNYNLFTNNELAFLDFYKNEKFFSEIGDKFNALMIYSILKSIETGENWTDAIDVNEFIILSLQWIMQSMHPNSIPKNLNDLIESLDFEKIKKVSKKTIPNGLAHNLKPLYDSLQKKYPKEFDIMDFSFKKPQSSWQEHIGMYQNISKKFKMGRKK